ncbi:MAG: ABC transporter permease [Ignavibacteriae bacterium]|nr:ABC transporter permease [Ignavibacteriota bacterium]
MRTAKRARSDAMTTSPIVLIAQRELTITVRNRWTVIMAAVFGVLMLVIAWAGVAAEGYDGMADFTRTSASMVNLVLYVVPLMALVLATLSFAGDRGTTELLFSQPVSRTEVMLGKIAGLFVAMGGAMVAGFIVSGGVILFQTGTEGIGGFIAFAVMTLLLGLIFLCVGALATMLAGRRPRSFGFAILLWFHFVLFYDLVVLGLASQLRGQSAVTALFLSLFGNPVDLVRVASLIVLDNETIFGATGAALLRFLGGPEVSMLVLVVAAMLWVGLPLLWARVVLRSQDI